MERHKRALLVDALAALAVALIVAVPMLSLQTPVVQVLAVSAVVAIGGFVIRFTMRHHRDRKHKTTSDSLRRLTRHRRPTFLHPGLRIGDRSLREGKMNPNAEKLFQAFDDLDDQMRLYFFQLERDKTTQTHLRSLFMTFRQGYFRFKLIKTRQRIERQWKRITWQRNGQEDDSQTSTF